MRLLITEKYSVARDYVIPALGGIAEKFTSVKYNGMKGWVKTVDGSLVTWAQGHLLGCNYDKSGSNLWDINKLPFQCDIDRYTVEPMEGTYGRSATYQLNQIKKIFTSYPIEVVYNLGDCEREGELIQREILNYVGWNGKVLRGWSSDSLTVSNMRSMIDNARPSEEFDELYRSGLYRQYSDFYIGMNLTEMATVVGRKYVGGKQVFSLGRVQTPLLCYIAKRQLEIEAFQVSKSNVITKSFQIGSNNLDYLDLLKDSELVHYPPTDEGNLNMVNEINKLVGLHKEGKYTVTTSEIKETNKSSPPLFSLVTLQKYMAGKYGWKAEYTADIADKLYKAGMSTYPRTSGQHLSEDMSIKTKYAKLIEMALDSYYPNVRGSLGIEDWKSLTSRVWGRGKAIFNTKALEDTKAAHDAYIITDEFIKNNPTMNSDSKDPMVILGFEVLRRMIMITFSPVVLESVEIQYSIDSYIASIVGTRVKSDSLVNSYLAMYPEHEFNKNEEIFMTLDRNTSVKIDFNQDPLFNTREFTTKPPARPTVISCLDFLDRNNLGTAATKGGFLPGLISKGYCVMNGKYVYATEKGVNIYKIFKDSVMSNEEMTKEMESYLEQVAEGKITKEVYQDVLSKLAHESKDLLITGFPNLGMIETVSQGDENTVDISEYMCPKCNSNLTTYNRFQGARCSCGLFLPSSMLGHRITIPEMIEILKGGYAHGHDFKSRNGKKFSAKLYLGKDPNTAEYRLLFRFD